MNGERLCYWVNGTERKKWENCKEKLQPGPLVIKMEYKIAFQEVISKDEISGLLVFFILSVNGFFCNLVLCEGKKLLVFFFFLL